MTADPTTEADEAGRAADSEPVRPEWVKLTADTIGLEKGTVHRVLAWVDEARPVIDTGAGNENWPWSWEPASPPVPETPPTVMVELSRSDAEVFAANVWADDPNKRRRRLGAACRDALGGNTDG